MGQSFGIGPFDGIDQHCKNKHFCPVSTFIPFFLEVLLDNSVIEYLYNERKIRGMKRLRDSMNNR
jgi:polyferredoxin